MAIRFLTQKTTAPEPSVMCVFQVSSFLMSMIWIYILAEIIVALLEIIGLITGLPSALLGLTILSWGNSVGDAIASISISKVGLGEMAVTGCIAGPAFNLMCGLGITTLVTNLSISDGIVIDIHRSEGLSSLVTILSALIIHVIFCTITFANDFKVKQKHAKIFVVIYLVDIIILIAFAILQ
mmetsp:Transcript_35111/g.46214  ORF Transcript_35111/g.46214 Transcript_35111/m.46214 type:complete len:182 (+) Transcript_35111:1410-1955(+)